ncbi:porin family protein [Flagellimonas pacifica]|uniref:Outer membrane protein beta-barrel domain-containing protein n=1 Tax=Flagellimonas pacifica TaxID=1247520 RepID=A0A285MV93_9FLAO|nr:porin family protein [Allomuricauda parva]SNZ01104.1 Outer membrane protein beta-barrel domain-containing protein [Allomuricauda parva]
MKFFLVFVVLIFSCKGLMAQETLGDQSSLDKYLEDQFYIGVGYNILLKRPDNAVQRNLSYNLQVGFIKDVPLNKRRNFGFGLGLGYAANSYYSNIEAKENGDEITYEIKNDEELKRSKFEIHTVEMPFELRWRTSTSDEYKFWRVYAGAKLGYVFSGRSKLVSEMEVKGFSNDDIENLQYGLTLSFGYNTWNLHAYYGLNPILKDGTSMENGSPINIRPLRIGVIFYIL